MAKSVKERVSGFRKRLKAYPVKYEAYKQKERKRKQKARRKEKKTVDAEEVEKSRKSGIEEPVYRTPQALAKQSVE